MTKAERTSRSPDETRRLAEELGRRLGAGDVVGLVGDLGSGKTCFVRGLARGLDLDPGVVYSPTFTLVAEHFGRLGLHHVDLFRLPQPADPADVEETGLLDLLAGTGVTVIEWFERIEEWADAPTLRIGIEDLGGEVRRLSFQGPARLVEPVAAG